MGEEEEECVRMSGNARVPLPNGVCPSYGYGGVELIVALGVEGFSGG